MFLKVEWDSKLLKKNKVSVVVRRCREAALVKRFRTQRSLSEMEFCRACGKKKYKTQSTLSAKMPYNILF